MIGEHSASDRSDLTGRVALITGAGRGIGKCLAIGLASAGVAVVVAARSVDELGATVDSIRRTGGRAHAIPADLADLDSIDRLATEAPRAFGQVELLVNNAAMVGPLGPTASLDPREVREAFVVNVVSVVALSGAFVPGMVAGGWGQVVNVSSGVVDRPASMIGGNTYAASKSALEAHTMNLAAELAGTGVRVNVYRPGTVDTAMQAHIRSQDPKLVGGGLVERFETMHASGSLVTAERSAAVLLDRLREDENGAVWNFDH